MSTEISYNQADLKAAYDAGINYNKGTVGQAQQYTFNAVLESLDKKEEQTYGEWMRSNPEQPTSPLGGKYEAMNNAYKEINSPSIEKMAEELRMDEISIFYRRMKKIGINLQLVGNYPWIYLNEVNGNKVKREDFVNANHGFQIGWSGVKKDSKPKLIDDWPLIFKMIRKYR